MAMQSLVRQSKSLSVMLLERSPSMWKVLATVISQAGYTIDGQAAHLADAMGLMDSCPSFDVLTSL